MKKLLASGLAFLMTLSIFAGFPLNSVSAAGSALVVVHYNRPSGDYDGWTLWLWADDWEGAEYKFSASDSFGKIAVLRLPEGTTKAGFIVRKGDWEEKDVEEDRFIEIVDNSAEVWLSQGKADIVATAPAGAEVYTLGGNIDAAPADATDAAADGLKVKVHYHRFDEKYDDWNLWLWPFERDGAGYSFNGMDDYGAVLEAVVPDSLDVEKLGFIVRKGDWELKDVDGDRFVDAKKVNADGAVEFYLVQGDAAIFDSADKIDLTPKFLGAQIDNATNIGFTVTKPMNIAAEGLADTFIVTDSSGRQIPVTTVLSKDKGIVSNGMLIFADPLDFTESYAVFKEGYGNIAVTMGRAVGTAAFAEQFTYNGDDLGAVYTKEKTSFRLWAPTAADVTLKLYDEGSGDCLIKDVPMAEDVNGTWTAAVSEDLNGIYYTYSVTVGGQINEAVDPYAKAAGVNGKRGMIVDLSSTNPSGWNSTKRPIFKNMTDAIVYEMHIRDFSIDESSGIKNKGKYLGLTERGTKNAAGLATGLDHLKELGVNFVQLQPSFDYRSIDESKPDTPQFNWGYDPENYNLPEGSYSSDPTRGAVRINEFKQMVETLHKNDIRVIMDVVYNHTGATADSNFNLIVPNYYYRQDAAGGFSNGSGCGNEIASERAMVRKFIIDSVTYWVSEYKIDGFRFDLMGLHDIETMNAVRAAVDKVDPGIIIYGEGWTAGGEAINAADSALKANAAQLEKIGAFNDDIRDAIKGHVFKAEDKGFVSGAMGMEDSLKFGIVGSTEHPQVNYENCKYFKEPWALEPYQSINYAEAHDNFTLWDKLATSNGADSEADRIKMDMLSAAIMFTSQGVPFFQLGQDFLRTKPAADGKFDENSYKSPDSVNSIKWDRKSDYSTVYSYYKGLIALRKAHPALRMMTTKEVAENLKFLDTEANIVGYTIDGNANDDSAKRVLVLFNANTETKNVTLPEGKWNAYAEGDKAGTKALADYEGSVTVAPISAVILMQGEKNSFTMIITILIIIGAGGVVFGLERLAFHRKKTNTADAK